MPQRLLQHILVIFKDIINRTHVTLNCSVVKCMAMSTALWVKSCDTLATAIGRLVGPVVRKPISANPGLSFHPGFFLFVKSIFSEIFSALFKASNHRFAYKKAKRIYVNLSLKLPNLNLNFALTQVYLNPALNNPALPFFAAEDFWNNNRYTRLQTWQLLRLRVGFGANPWRWP